MPGALGLAGSWVVRGDGGRGEQPDLGSHSLPIYTFSLFSQHLKTAPLLHHVQASQDGNSSPSCFASTSTPLAALLLCRGRKFTATTSPISSLRVSGRGQGYGEKPVRGRCSSSSSRLAHQAEIGRLLSVQPCHPGVTPTPFTLSPRSP